jgi:hypothetical protein
MMIRHPCVIKTLEVCYISTVLYSFSSRSSCSLDMCHREVQSTKHHCGHALPHSEYQVARFSVASGIRSSNTDVFFSQVDCQSTRCRYSAFHPHDCHACPHTCQQWYVSRFTWSPWWLNHILICRLRQAQTMVTRTSETSCFHCGGRKG